MNDRPVALKLAYYAAAALLVLLAVGPALWLVNVAFQPKQVVNEAHEIVRQYGVSDVTRPDDYVWTNFAGALGISELSELKPQPTVWLEVRQRVGRVRDIIAISWERGLLRPLLNSIFVTVMQTVLNVLLAALAAYPLARMRFRGRGAIFVLVLATLMVPEQVIVVPLYVTIIDLGLADTLLAVFLPFSVTAFGIYLCRQAFLAIPLELEEAARVDGAGAGRVWWHVMLPLARPTLATLATFSIIGAWSNLLWPLIVLQSADKQTLPVAISGLLSVFAAEVRYAYAAGVLALIPMVVMYLVMQRWLTRGLLAGAVKG